MMNYELFHIFRRGNTCKKGRNSAPFCMYVDNYMEGGCAKMRYF